MLIKFTPDPLSEESLRQLECGIVLGWVSAKHFPPSTRHILNPIYGQVGPLSHLIEHKKPRPTLLRMPQHILDELRINSLVDPLFMPTPFKFCGVSIEVLTDADIMHLSGSELVEDTPQLRNIDRPQKRIK